MAALSHKSAKERVALILLILNQKYSNVNGSTAITMTKLDIARYAETSEETVVRILSFFAENDIIKNEGRLFEITAPNLLEIIAEGF